MSFVFSEAFTSLQKHYVELMNCLTSINHIVALLFEKKCMSERQRQQIMCIKNPYKITEELLSFIMRHQCMVTYNLFLEALQQTNQQHLYSLLSVKGWSGLTSEALTIYLHHPSI